MKSAYEISIKGKGENPSDQNFPVSILFTKVLLPGVLQPKSCCKGLTHYQTTNFRLFQTERVCRQQFQI